MSTDSQPGKTPIVLMGVMVAAAALAIFAVYMFMGQAAQSGPAVFVKTCVLSDEPTDPRCRSKTEIMTAWGVDVDAMIEERRVLMVSTVRRMVSGELTRRGIYQACVMRGQCAPIPLLPDNVDATAIAGGRDFLETRKAFWQLHEDSKLTPEICSFMDVCRAMRTAGVVTVQ